MRFPLRQLFRSLRAIPAIVSVAALLLAACARPATTAQPGATQQLSLEISGSPGAGYPAPTALSQGSGYPAPGGETAGPGPIVQPEVTPDPQRGHVRGKLLVMKEGTAQPVANQILYLAEILKDDAGVERAAAVDRQRSPRTMTDAEGRFVFMNVDPGRYGLVLDTVVDSYLLHDPVTGDSMLIETTAGLEVGLGELVFDSLPLP